MFEFSGHFLPSTAAHCQHCMPETNGNGANTANVTKITATAANSALFIVLIMARCGETINTVPRPHKYSIHSIILYVLLRHYIGHCVQNTTEF